MIISISRMKIITSLYSKPNGKEYVCNICYHIEYSLPTIEQHVMNHQIRDIESI